jgi:hypothetical protein
MPRGIGRVGSKTNWVSKKISRKAHEVLKNQDGRDRFRLHC